MMVTPRLGSHNGGVTWTYFDRRGRRIDHDRWAELKETSSLSLVARDQVGHLALITHWVGFDPVYDLGEHVHEPLIYVSALMDHRTGTVLRNVRARSLLLALENHDLLLHLARSIVMLAGLDTAVWCAGCERFYLPHSPCCGVEDPQGA